MSNANPWPATVRGMGCFERSSFTEQISKECAFEIVSTAELLLTSLHVDWTRPRQSSKPAS